MFATVLIQTLLLILPTPAMTPLFGQNAAESESSLSTAPSANFRVTSIPRVPHNGTAVLFRINTSEIFKSIKGDFLERQVFFDFDASTGAWYGFAGVDIDTKPGLHPLHLEATRPDGSSFTFDFSTPTGSTRYRTIALSVPRRFTEPDEATQERIAVERDLKAEIFSRVTPMRWWTGPFVPPIESPMTDPFGTRRTFNGKVQSAHMGQDFRADIGTPIGAMNRGKVILARDMFYEGGLVVIDHGQGLLTLYMHLSQINVREGDLVEKQQIIALSGDSGRATGPHLHVGIRWQGVYVNPAPLFSLPLP